MILKIDKTSTSEKVFQQIKDNIINDVWHRGEKIQSEIELAQSFGVSRNTVRTALQRLGAMGLLFIKHGERTIVAEGIYDENIINTIPYIEMDEKEWYEVLKFRSIVEVAMMRLAALNRSDDDLIELKKCTIEIVEFRKNHKAELSTFADLRFHICMAAATKNKAYYNFVIKMKDIWFSQQRMSRLKFTEEYYDLHGDIYEAILQKDAEKARKDMRAHLEYRLNEINLS